MKVVAISLTLCFRLTKVFNAALRPRALCRKPSTITRQHSPGQKHVKSRGSRHIAQHVILYSRSRLATQMAPPRTSHPKPGHQLLIQTSTIPCLSKPHLITPIDRRPLPRQLHPGLHNPTLHIACLQPHADRPTANHTKARHRPAIPHVRDVDGLSSDSAHVRGLQHRECGPVSAGHMGVCSGVVSLHERVVRVQDDTMGRTVGRTGDHQYRDIGVDG